MYVLICQFAVVLTGLMLLILDHMDGTYVAVNTGVHPDLSGHIMLSFTGRSAVECGTKCQTLICTSFRFHRPPRTCFLYDVFMSYSSPLDEQFYTIPGAEDATVADCGTPRTYNSSIINVALGKNVTMSSQFNDSTPGSLLVDGILRNMYPCGRTASEPYPYMIVDLGQSYNIYSLYILNRKNMENWFYRVRIALGETLDVLRNVQYQEDAIGCDVTYFLPTLTSARYVKLTKEIHANTLLFVCELAVYAVV